MAVPMTAESAEASVLANELNASLRDAFANSIEYEKVYVLLIHWEDGESEIAEESQQLLSFFNDIWRFSTSIVPIPSERSQAALQNAISNFIFNCRLSKESLLLVHYGGHGDANAEELKAIWAA